MNKKPFIYTLVTLIVLLVELLTPLSALAQPEFMRPARAVQSRPTGQELSALPAAAAMAADFRAMIASLPDQPGLRAAAASGANLVLEDYTRMLSYSRSLAQAMAPARRISYAEIGFPAARMGDINAAYSGLLMGYLNQGQMDAAVDPDRMQSNFSLAMVVLASHAQALKEQGESSTAPLIPDRIGNGGPRVVIAAKAGASVSAKPPKMVGEWQYASSDPQSAWQMKGDAASVAAFNQLFSGLYGQDASGKAQGVQSSARPISSLNIQPMGKNLTAQERQDVFKNFVFGPAVPQPAIGWDEIAIKISNPWTYSYYLNTVGSAFFPSDHDRVRLTNNTAGQTGAVWYKAKVPMNDQFSAYFKYKLQSPNGSLNSGYADGLTFSVSPAAPSMTWLGAGGGWLGYQAANNTNLKSFALEFDKFINSYDPDQGCGLEDMGFFSFWYPERYTDLAVLKNYNAETHYKSTCLYTDPNAVISVWADYNGARLEVRYSNSDTRPTAASLVYDGNLDLNGDSVIGFTAATGAVANDHDILYLAFDNKYRANGVDLTDVIAPAFITTDAADNVDGIGGGVKPACATFFPTDASGSRMLDRKIDFSIVTGAGTLTSTPAYTDATTGKVTACVYDNPGQTVIKASTQSGVSTNATVVTMARLALSKGYQPGIGAAGSISDATLGVLCDLNCNSVDLLYPKGTLLDLTATPAKGSSFGGWWYHCAGSGSCQLTMTDMKQAMAIFKSFKLTVAKNGGGDGTVTSDPDSDLANQPANNGIACGSTCADNYGEGAVTLVAVPGADSVFSGWSEPSCSDTVASCTVDLTWDATVTATFDKSADLSIDKSGPLEISEGNEITYTLSAANQGPAGAASVVVEDTLPTELTFVSATPSQGFCWNGGNQIICSLGTLNKDGSATISVKAIVNAGVRNQAISNTSVIYSASSDPNLSNNVSMISTQALLADISAALTLPATSTAGAAITYTLAAANAGPTNGLGVKLTSSVPSMLSNLSFSPPGLCSVASAVITCDFGAVAKSASKSVDVTATIDPAVAAGTSLPIVAAVTSGVPDAVLANNTASASVTAQTSADLKTTASAPASVVAGNGSTFTFTVANLGPSDARTVQFTQTLPANITVTRATPTQGSCTPSTSQILCSIGTISASGTATVEVEYSADAALPNNTLLATTATVSSSTSDPSAANNTASVSSMVTAAADLALVRSAMSWVAGTSGSYTLTVSNSGPSSAQGVTLSDVIPSPLVYTSSSSSVGSCSQSAGTVSCALGALARGSSATVTVNLTIPPSLANGSAPSFSSGLVSSTTTDPIFANNSNSASAAIQAQADLVVSATAPATVTAGTNMTYTFWLSNSGPSDAAGATVTVTLPVGTSYVSSTKTQGGSSCLPSGQTVTCSLSSLALNASASGTITVRADAARLKDSSLSASFTASLGITDPVSSNDTTTKSTTVQTSADLSLSAAVAASGDAGTGLTYTWMTANAGPSYAAAAVLTSTLPSTLSFVSSDLGSCTALGQVVTCALGVVPNGNNAIARFTVLAASSLGYADQIVTSAQVVSTASDANSANNSASATTSATLKTDLAIALSGPASTVAGAEMTYLLTLSNAGPSDSPGATVKLTLPAGIVYVSSSPAAACTESVGTVTCQAGNLVKDGTTSYQVVALPDYSLDSGTILSASAVVTQNVHAVDPAAPNNSASFATTITTAADIAASITGPAQLYIAYQGIYQLTVSNNGPSLARSVTITEDLPVGVAFDSADAECSHDGQAPGRLTCAMGDIAPGQSHTVILTLNLDQTLENEATFTNQIAALTSTPETATTDNAAALTTSVATSSDGLPADLSLGLVAPAVIGAGGKLTYLLTLYNYGPVKADSTSLTANLPAGVTFLTAQAPVSCVLDGTQLTCTPGSLQPGQSRILRLPVQVPIDMAADTSLAFDASLSGNIADITLTNNSVQMVSKVVVSADLQVKSSVDQASVDPGTTLTYTVTAQNLGPSIAQSVVLTDTLPTDIRFVSLSDPSGKCVLASGQITCGVDVFAPGETFQFSYQVIPLQGGVLANQALLSSPSGDPRSSNNAASASAQVNAPVRQTQTFGMIEVTANVFQQVQQDVWVAEGDVRIGRDGMEYFRLANSMDSITLNNNDQSIQGSGFVRLVSNDFPVFLGAFTGSFDGTLAFLVPQNLTTDRFDLLGDFSVQSAEISQLDLSGGKVNGAASIAINEPKAQTVHITFELAADGSMAGTVDAFTTTVAGVSIAVAGAEISDTLLSAASVTVTLPVILGGASGNVQGLRITKDSFSLSQGSVTFPLPDMNIGTGKYVLFTKNTATLGYNVTKGWFLTVGTTLQLNLPSNKKSYPFSYTLWVDSIKGFSIDGLLPSLNLDFSGFNLDLSNLNLSFDGFKVDLGKLKLPPLWGGIDIDMPFPEIGDFGIRFNGIPTIRVPDISFGKYLSLSDLVLTFDIFNGDYIFDAVGKVHVSTPGTQVNADVNLNIDAAGGLSGTLASLAVKAGGTTISMTNLQFSNDGLSVSKGTVTLPPRFGSVTSELDTISLDGDGLHIGGGATFKIPEIRIGDGQKIRFTTVTLTIREAAGQYVLDGQGTLHLNLPANAVSLTASFSLDESGNLSGTVDQLVLNLSGSTLTMNSLELVNSGMRVGSARLAMPSKLGGSSGSVSSVTIDADGLHFAGTLTLDLPDVTFGTPASDKIRIKSLHAALSESPTGYLLAVNGTLSLNIPSNIQDIAASFEISTAGDLSGTIQTINLTMASCTLALTGVQLDNGGLSVSTAALTMSNRFGGASGQVYNLSINASGLHLGGTALISLPDLRFGNTGRVSIQNAVAILQESSGGYTFGITGNLVLNLPSNTQRVAVAVSLDSAGNLSGSLDQLSLSVGGATLKITQLAFSNDGLAASNASLVLSAALGGSSAAVQSVVIDQNGLSFGSGSLKVSLPDIQFGGGGDKLSVTGIQATLAENNGTYAFSADGTLVINLPANNQRTNIAFSLDSNGNFSASLGKLTLSLAGSAINATQITFSNRGLSTSSVTITLPPSLGNGSVALASLAITQSGIDFGPGGASVSIPEIQLGSGGKVKIKSPTLTVSETSTGYAFGAKGILSINIPSMATETAFTFKVDTQGNLHGTIPHMEMKLSGGLVTMDNLQLGNFGFSVDAATLTLPGNMGGSNVTLKQVRIDGDGFHVGSGTVRINLPDITAAGGQFRLAQVKVLLTVGTVNGQEVYGLQMSGKAMVRVPENSMDLDFSAMVDANGNFEAAIDSLRIKMAGMIVSTSQMKITSKGMKAAQATIGVSLGNLPVEAVLKNVVIDGSGLTFDGGGFRVAIPDIQVGSTSGMTLKGGVLTMEIAGDKTYKASLSGSLTIQMPSLTASAKGVLTVDSRGNMSGSVSDFAMNLVGMGLSAKNVRLADDILYIDEASLQMPAKFGGGFVAIYNVEASPRNFSIGGGEFALPAVKSGGVSLGELRGRLKKQGDTWIIGAGGKFLLGNTGSSSACFIRIFVEMYYDPNNNMVVDLTSPSGKVVASPAVSAPSPASQPADFLVGNNPPPTGSGIVQAVGALGLREITCGLDGCDIPIGSTGVYLTRVEGRFSLVGETTRISLNVTVAAGPKIFGSRAIQGDVGLTIIPQPFQMDMAGAVSIFSMFSFAQMQAKLRPNAFAATIHVDTTFVAGFMSLAMWDQGGDFYLVGSGRVDVGLREGSVWEGCFDTYIFGEWCISVPPFDLVFTVGADFGRFTNGAWGFKAYFYISFFDMDFEIGFYLDDRGNFSLGDVSGIHTVTPPSIASALALQSELKAGNRVALRESSKEEKFDARTLHGGAAGETYLDVSVGSNQDALFILARGSAIPDFSVISPDGVEYTSAAPGPLRYMEQPMTRPYTDQNGDPQTASYTQVMFAGKKLAGGIWKMKIGPTPNNEQFIATPMVVHPGPQLTDLAMQKSGVNQAALNWKLTSAEADLKFNLYATRDAITEMVETTDANNNPVTVEQTVFSGNAIQLNVATKTDGSLSTLSVDLNDLPSGTYHLWAEADDGMNQLLRKYFPGVITVAAPWVNPWKANLSAVPGFRMLDLSWASAPGPDGSNFRVVVTPPDGPAWTQEVGNLYSTQIYGLTPGLTYQVRLEAVDETNNRLATSETISGVPDTAQFNLAASSQAISLVSGQAQSIDAVLTTSLATFPETVKLSIEGLPDGLVAKISSPFLIPTSAGASQAVLFSAADTLKSGIYTLNLVANGIGLKKSLPITVTVQQPWFELQADQVNVTLSKGESKTIQITAPRFLGQARNINLHLPILPGGLFAELDNEALMPGQVANLVLNDSSQLKGGSYPLEILSEDGLTAQTLTVNLTVNKPAFSLSSTGQARPLLLPGESVDMPFSLDKTSDWTEPIQLTLGDLSQIPGAVVGFVQNSADTPQSQLTVSAPADLYLKVVTSAGAKAGIYPLEVKASALGETKVLTMEVEIPSDPDLVDLAVSVSEQKALVGFKGSYTITLANRGPAAAANIYLTHVIPSSALTMVRIQPSQGSCTVMTNNYVCALGSLARNGSVQVLVTIQLTRDVPVNSLLNFYTYASTSSKDSDSFNNALPTTLLVGPPYKLYMPRVEEVK